MHSLLFQCFDCFVLQSLISHHIVLGGREEANDRQMLRDLGVTHVLNAAQQLPNYHEGSFVYLKIPIIGAHYIGSKILVSWLDCDCML
jgi:hypothetical protein